MKLLVGSLLSVRLCHLVWVRDFYHFHFSSHVNVAGIDFFVCCVYDNM